MKAEVLAEWRTRLADRTLITLPAGAVERLLDERAALLEEFRRASAQLCIFACPRTLYADGETEIAHNRCCDYAKAAIQAAEEP